MKRSTWVAGGFLLGLLVAATFGFADRETGLSDAPKQDAAARRKDGATAPKKEESFVAKADEQKDDGKLRIVCFGGHPDDCEIRAGGTGAMWAERGHHVMFVSATNGDIGHFQMAGGPLAVRRYREVQEAAEVLGVTTRVLDIHDGELMPTLENRRTFTRLIRRWNADIVMGHRPNDYHPDHRYTGVLMQDSAFMVAVPFFCPDTKHLDKNPVFLFYWDHFQQPNPFEPDVVVSIDSVIEKKVDALSIMESQFYEGGALGYTRPLPQTAQENEMRRGEVRERFKARFAKVADDYRDKLNELYGEQLGGKVEYAEAFEVCEYGRQPSAAELRELFPFFPDTP